MGIYGLATGGLIMPTSLDDCLHLYVVVALVCGGFAMMGAAWLWGGP